jgi:hypothetical protein
MLAALLSAPLLAQYSGEWPLDAGSGGITADISGNANDGTLNNFGPAPWLPGSFGNALAFDGVDDYVSLADQTSVYDGLGSPYSISYWIKAPAQQNSFVYAEGTIGTIAILIFGSGQYLPDADKFRVYCRNDQGDVPFTGVSNAVVYDDTWHHVTFVDVSGQITLHVDGVVDTGSIAYDPARLPGMPGHGTFSNNTASMGALRRGTVCCNMNGLVDDLRVYRFAMTQTDVLLAMNGVPLLPPSASIGEYGSGCGAGPLDLAGSGSAVLGGPGLQLDLQQGRPGALAFVVCGLGDLLPVDLGVAGFPGCTLYPQQFASAYLGLVDPVGSAPGFLFAIPPDPALTYQQLNCQGVTLDAAAVEFSDVVMAVLGG